MKYLAVIACLVAGMVLLFGGFTVAQAYHYTISGCIASLIGVGLLGVAINLVRP